MSFAPGVYAFPGGAVDESDWASHDPYRQAAVREMVEETGVVLDPDSLILWAHWITPIESPKRFDTYFYLCAASEGVVIADGDGEAEHHIWATPQTILDAYRGKELVLFVPTAVTLRELAAFSSVSEIVEATHRRPITVYDGIAPRPEV
jgi:8-oxo-dGTP pyrophosphatase MutT (NUDIX family)